LIESEVTLAGAREEEQDPEIEREEVLEVGEEDSRGKVRRFGHVALHSAAVGLLGLLAAAVSVSLRIARDSIDELSAGVAILFGVLEAMRILATQLLARMLLGSLDQWDDAFDVRQERTNFRQGKAYILDFCNHNIVFLYIVLTAACGDPRDFSWRTRCYSDDCLADVQITLWSFSHPYLILCSTIAA